MLSGVCRIEGEKGIVAMRIQWLFVAALMAQLGCSTMLSQKTAKLVPSRITKDTGETVTLPGQLRMVILKKRNGSFTTCAEPSPDTALSDAFRMMPNVVTDTAASISPSTGGTFSGSSKQTVNNDVQSSTTAIELAGRTQTVLLARELLFRTCEAAANDWLSPEDVKKAHTDIKTLISDMVEVDGKKAKTAGVLVAAAAVGSLEPKILQKAEKAFTDAIQDSCLKAAATCNAKASSEEEKIACGKALLKCVN